jgi:hypothetical protein
MPDHPNDPHRELRKKFREIIDDPNMLWGMEIEAYDLLEKDTRLPLASINLANEEALIAEACGRFRITIKGYDDDPRQVFDIPEVRGWFEALHKDAPHFPFFLEPELIVVYAAALLPHTYQNAELKFETGVIEGFVQEVLGAIEVYCEKAKVDPEEAIETVLRLFGMYPRPDLPGAEFVMPLSGRLFALDMDAVSTLHGDGSWRRIDLAFLAALGAVLQESKSAGQEPPSLSVWAHLEEGHFGAFLVGASDEQAETFGRLLRLRFTPEMLTEGGAMPPTRHALPFWALREGELLRCAEEDPDEGPILLVPAFDGEEWSYEAFAAEPEIVEEQVEAIAGVTLVSARVVEVN